MGSDLQFPKLRWPIDVQMHQAGNEHVVVIQCPIGLVAKPLILSGAVAPLLNCFNGTRSIEQIESEFSSYGVKRPLIEELARMLDNNLFLATDRFYAAHERMKLEFITAPVRPAALAGLSYSNIPEQLSAEIDRYLGPGSKAKGGSPKKSSLAVLVSPHIDYRRGGSCYGKAYQELRSDSPDLQILIGTAHQYSSLLFHLTRKDFASPLGLLPCDHLFVDRLAGRYGNQRSYADELLHRREHSLELQLPFLARVKPGSTIVPVLVGSFHRMVGTGTPPNEIAEYDEFAAALTETVQDAVRDGKQVSFIAGVDMAHVGQHFGDPEELTPDFMRRVEARDKIYLDALVQHDKRALFNHIAEDNDARKICGFPTMYTVLDVCDRLGWKIQGELIDYQQAVDYKSDCAVTFAAVTLRHAA